MDRDTRVLERSVESDISDSTARRRLTIERLRTMSGLVILWSGGGPPHDGAVIVNMVTNTPPLMAGDPPGKIETSGWALAVAGSHDLFDVISASRGGSVVDLSTGRFLSTSASPSVGDFKVASESAHVSVDALGRPRDTRKIQSPVPSTFVLSSYVTRNPIYDSEWDDGVGGDVDLFNSPSIFINQRYRNIPKIIGHHTNVYTHGCLPRGHSFSIIGVSIELLDEQERHLNAASSIEWVAGYVLKLIVGHNIIIEQPLNLFLREPVTSKTEDSISVSLPTVPIFPFVVPVLVEDQENLRVIIRRQERRNTQALQALVRVTLDGYLTRVRCG